MNSNVKPEVIRQSRSQQAFDTAARLHAEGKFEQAEELLRAAMALDPGNISLGNARGVMLAAMKQYSDAVRCYHEVLACDPNAPEVWMNLGNALTPLNQLKSAIACHRRALALSGGKTPLLHHNLGVSLVEAGRHAEAIVAFNNAIKLDPDQYNVRWDRALSYLYLGNYSQGWADYEMRKLNGKLSKRSVPGEPWDGSPFAGKTLLVMAEQGLGDMIWVARYFPQVKALGGKLIIECRPELVTLIESMGVADQIVTAGAALPPADLNCYLCSLPGLFTPDIASIPQLPYLSASPDRVARISSIFSQSDKLKVGIVWSGNVMFGKNSRRSQPLSNFIQACALPGVQLYSLQKGSPEKDLKDLPAGGQIVDLGPHLKDFADTAAIVAHLDLVIMTDSSVAHLAGAMGKSVWVLLGHSPHWLWLLDRKDSPWYPSMRLFRRSPEGAWDYVFDSVSVELLNLAEKYLG
jgi:Flp pilus assembly protein TadD